VNGQHDLVVADTPALGHVALAWQQVHEHLDSRPSIYSSFISRLSTHLITMTHLVSISLSIWIFSGSEGLLLVSAAEAARDACACLHKLTQ
jgi:hypothetical protein